MATTRLQAANVAAQQQHQQQPELEDPEPVTINWLFFDKSRPPACHVIEIPYRLYNKPSQDCQELFAEELRNWHRFEADLYSVTFWEKISPGKLKKGWPATLTDVETFTEAIQGAEYFSDIFEGELDDELVHLIVTAERVRDKTPPGLPKIIHPEPVDIKWLFFNKSRPPGCHTVEIPHRLFNKPSQYCRELFVKELRNRHSFKADLYSVRFWQPTGHISFTKFKKGWPVDFTNVETLAEAIKGAECFSDVLKGEPDDELIHLIVTADRAEQVRGKALPSLPEILHFRKNIRYTPPAPSKGAKFPGYASIQRQLDGAIYDGLYPRDDYPTTAAPINIFHPVFEAFTRRVQRPKQEPTRRYLRLVGKLMNLLTQIYRPDWVFMEALEEVLGHTLFLENDGGETRYIVLEVEGIRIRLCFTELKVEMDKWGSEPSIQAGLSVRSFWVNEKNFFPVRDKTCCPTMLLAGGGAWLAVLGAIFTDRPIVQRLTETLWLGNSTTHRDGRLMHLAHVFLALHDSIQDLAEYYTAITTDQSLQPFKKDSNDPHPRFFPYVTAVELPKYGLVQFKYLRRLEDDASCVTFLALAQLGDGSEKEIVVKFVTMYGGQAHHLLHEKGYAPELYYHGPIPTTGTNLHTIPLLDDKDSLRRRPLPLMNMIVMEYIKPGTWPATRDIAEEQLKAAFKYLHSSGYVFGDLRKPNVLFTQVEAKLKLIDFDWAGAYKRDGNGELVPPTDEDSSVDWAYAYYPSGLSPAINWPKGVDDYAAILPEHDDKMMDELLDQMYMY